MKKRSKDALEKDLHAAEQRIKVLLYDLKEYRELGWSEQKSVKLRQLEVFQSRVVNSLTCGEDFREVVAYIKNALQDLQYINVKE